MANISRIPSDEEIKVGWRAYKLGQIVIDRVSAGGAVREQRSWTARHNAGDLHLFAEIGDPTKNGHPSFVTSIVKYRGKIVLHSIYDQYSHIVATFEPGRWERMLKSLPKGAGKSTAKSRTGVAS